MADVKCPSCGSPNVEQIDVDKYQCPYCGATFNHRVRSQVEKISSPDRVITIHGYTQWFAVNYDIHIFYNGQQIGKVSKDELFQVSLSSPCQLVFKCSIRSTSLVIDPAVDTDVYLSFDRITGSIKASKQQGEDNGAYVSANVVPLSGQAPVGIEQTDEIPQKKTKSRAIAAVLALCLGGLGAHHFYLGNYIRGIIYLVLCWTYIPSIVGCVEGIIYLAQSDEVFASKH